MFELRFSFRKHAGLFTLSRFGHWAIHLFPGREFQSFGMARPHFLETLIGLRRWGLGPLLMISWIK